MRLSQGLRAIPGRLRREPYWICLLMQGGGSIAFTFYAIHKDGMPLRYGLGMGGIDLLWTVLFTLLSPLPWQWTGDDRWRMPFARGFLQAFGFILGLHFLLSYTAWWGVIRHFDPAPFRYSVLRMLVSGIGPYWYWIFVGNLLAAADRVELEKRAAVAEARHVQWLLLRDQISPQVLYQSLDGLAELVHHDAPATERGLLDLSALYRQLLYHGDRLRVRLGDERALVDRFLRVEHLRLGSRLSVSWGWDASLDELEGPPLLLLPLVENALKHGVMGRTDGGELRVEGRLEKGCVELAVGNTGAPLAEGAQPGPGLQNLESRLRMAYGAESRLHLGMREGWTVARLHFSPAEFRLDP